MTDTLIRDEPSDTGEIPAVDPGTTTANLTGYAAGLPPVLRRPDAVLNLLGELEGPQPKPRPLPRPQPESPPVGWWARLRYKGMHRAAGR